jgi:hypothetical protein
MDAISHPTVTKINRHAIEQHVNKIIFSGPQDLEGKNTSSQGRGLLRQFCWSQSPGNQNFLAQLHKESYTKKFILGIIK